MTLYTESFANQTDHFADDHFNQTDHFVDAFLCENVLYGYDVVMTL